jgi:hypothetical protein
MSLLCRTRNTAAPSWCVPRQRVSRHSDC